MTTRTDKFAAGTPTWNDVAVDDLDAAITFYSRLFGWHVEHGPAEFGGYSNATAQGSLVAGLAPKMAPDMPSVWTTYLATDDIDATTAAITAHGGTIAFPAMAVMDLGSMAIAADPAGAVFGLWQAGTHTGFQRYNEPGSVTWNEVFVSDFDAGKAFYGAVFGYTFDDVGGSTKYASMQIEGNRVAGIGELGGVDMPAAGQPVWNTYFSVADADAVTAQVDELGGTVLSAAQDTPYGRIALVADPSGAPFSLHQAPAVGSSN